MMCGIVIVYLEVSYLMLDVKKTEDQGNYRSREWRQGKNAKGAKSIIP